MRDGRFVGAQLILIISLSAPTPNLYLSKRPSSSLKEVVQSNGLVAIGAFQSLAALACLKAHLHQVVDLVVHSDFLGVVLCPLSSLSVELIDVVFVHLSNNRILWII